MGTPCKTKSLQKFTAEDKTAIEDVSKEGLQFPESNPDAEATEYEAKKQELVVQAVCQVVVCQVVSQAVECQELVVMAVCHLVEHQMPVLTILIELAHLGLNLSDVI